VKRLAAACILALVLGGAPGARAATAPAESLFAAGNAAYETGDYAGAIDRYLELDAMGVAHPDLCYNLGNAWFKTGELGRAVLWYERARRLEPRNGDVRENLSVVRSLLRDRELLPKEGGLRGALLAWHRGLSASESVAVASGFYALLCAAAILMVFRRSAFVTRLYARLSWFSPARLFGLDMAQDFVLAISLLFVATAMFTASSWTKIRDADQRLSGVVVAEEASVFSGPSRDSIVQFKVHEGTIVSVRDARGGWVRVDLRGDLSGWVDAGSVDRI
jgi:tetratricopeptide (TPR) repeat protein